jgi:hypothetical protein
MIDIILYKYKLRPYILRPLACWECVFESCLRHGCLSHLSVACCQVQVSASGWSLVRRIPTHCGVSECDGEAAIMRMPWPISGCCTAEIRRKDLYKFTGNKIYCSESKHNTAITTNSKLAVKVEVVRRICKENSWIIVMANILKARADHTVRFLLSYLLLSTFS